MKLAVNLLALVLLPFAAEAQFSLYRVAAGGEQPVAGTFDFGAIDPNVPAKAAFRIRNTSADAATLTTLAVSGVGFTLAGPATPMTLAAQAAVDFAVTFAGPGNGLYSAVLNAPGISVLLVAQVQQGLTYSVSTPSGWQSLSTAAAVDFGKTTVPSPVVMHFLVQNPSPLYLNVPALILQGNGFALFGTSPSGILLAPQATAAFEIVFTPATAGTFAGSLQAGGYLFPLSAAAAAPPLPKASLSVTLEQASSAQQGKIAIRFDAPSPVDASGLLALTFQAATSGVADSGIVFSSGAASIPFTLAAGSTQADFSGAASALFQTGTTAGVLTLTATVGSVAVQQTVTIAAAPVGIPAAQVTRGAAGITVQITAFDNTRTAGRVAYTFFDALGNAVAPGAITVDSTADFKAYFASSTAGGMFSLTAVFPVTGDSTLVKTCQVQLTNAAGTSSTQRIAF